MSDLVAFLRARLDDYGLNGSMWHDGCNISEPDGCRCEVFTFVGGDVQSKRAILDLCEHWMKVPDSEVADEMLLVLRWLAVAHADHRDYREEWRP